MEQIFTMHLYFPYLTLSDLMSLEAETGSLLQNSKYLMSSVAPNSELRKKCATFKVNLMSYVKKALILRKHGTESIQGDRARGLHGTESTPGGQRAGYTPYEGGSNHGNR